MTNNKMRSAPEIRKVLENGGGSLGAAGCVAWNFEKRGVLAVARDAAPEDVLMEKALEAGALDLKSSADAFQIVTDPQDLLPVKEALARAKIPVASAEILFLPKSTVQADARLSERILALLESLEDHDDVQAVHTNCDFDEAAVAGSGA